MSCPALSPGAVICWMSRKSTRTPATATATLTRARSMAPVWFRHQGVARSLVLELCEQQRRLSPARRELTTSIDPNGCAAYHRHEN